MELIDSKYFLYTKEGVEIEDLIEKSREGYSIIIYKAEASHGQIGAPIVMKQGIEFLTIGVHSGCRYFDRELFSVGTLITKQIKDFFNTSIDYYIRKIP